MSRTVHLLLMPLLILVACLAAAILVVRPASADVAGVVSTAVDVKPIFDALLAIVSSVLVTLGGWAVTWLGRKFKLEADAKVRGYLLDGVRSSVDYAVNQLRVAAGTKLTVDLRNELLATGAGYVITHFPDALRRFNVDAAGVERMVLSRLPPLGTDATTGPSVIYSPTL